MHCYRACGHYMCVSRVAILLMTIPHVAHDKLHETCSYVPCHEKDGPHKHITGYLKFYRVATCVHACKNEVIIELYCNKRRGVEPSKYGIR